MAEARAQAQPWGQTGAGADLGGPKEAPGPQEALFPEATALLSGVPHEELQDLV